MGTSQTFALYAGPVICLGCLIFAGIRMMTGGFQDAIPALFGAIRQNGPPFAGADNCQCLGLYRPELPTSDERTSVSFDCTPFAIEAVSIGG